VWIVGLLGLVAVGLGCRRNDVVDGIQRRLDIVKIGLCLGGIEGLCGVVEPLLDILGRCQLGRLLGSPRLGVGRRRLPGRVVSVG